jgi:hypothetical protein
VYPGDHCETIPNPSTMAPAEVSVSQGNQLRGMGSKCTGGR